MSNNIPITSGSGTLVATDQVTGTLEHVQLFKLAVDTAGQRVPIPASASNGLTVDVTRVSGAVSSAQSGTWNFNLSTSNPAYTRLIDGSGTAALLMASAANLIAQTSNNAALVTYPGNWSIVHAPTSNTQATISKGAVASTRHVCVGIYATLASGSTGATVPATPVSVTLRDGATGAGTILWQQYISISATAGSMARLDAGRLSIPGSVNTAMTLEFSAAGGANSFESVTLVGYDAT